MPVEEAAVDRHHGLEAALRRASDKFTARFGHMEAALAARDVSLPDASLDQMEAEWQRAKETA